MVFFIGHLFFILSKKICIMFKNLITKNRSYRRFYQNHKLTIEELKDLIELARLSASGRNLQPLKYYLSADEETNQKVFSTLAWAG